MKLISILWISNRTKKLVLSEKDNIPEWIKILEKSEISIELLEWCIRKHEDLEAISLLDHNLNKISTLKLSFASEFDINDDVISNLSKMSIDTLELDWKNGPCISQFFRIHHKIQSWSYLVTDDQILL